MSTFCFCSAIARFMHYLHFSFTHSNQTRGSQGPVDSDYTTNCLFLSGCYLSCQHLNQFYLSLFLVVYDSKVQKQFKEPLSISRLWVLFVFYHSLPSSKQILTRLLKCIYTRIYILLSMVKASRIT